MSQTFGLTRIASYLKQQPLGCLRQLPRLPLCELRVEQVHPHLLNLIRAKAGNLVLHLLHAHGQLFYSVETINRLLFRHSHIGPNNNVNNIK